jgi:hypothetical protein
MILLAKSEVHTIDLLYEPETGVVRVLIPVKLTSPAVSMTGGHHHP